MAARAGVEPTTLRLRVIASTNAPPCPTCSCKTPIKNLTTVLNMYCIVLYLNIYIALLNSHGQTEALLVQLAPEKRQVLRSDKDVERLDDKREARAEGGRRFQREGPITEKDLDMAMVVLVRGTKSSRLSRERRRRRDEAWLPNRCVLRFINIRCASSIYDLILSCLL